jgi:foldase protein PrsA
MDSQADADEHLDAYYRRNPQSDQTVRHLIDMPPRHEAASPREEARAKATRAHERIRNGEPFPEVAAEVSEEPGAEGRQGLLEPGRKGAWVGEFWDAASALQAGDVSPVVETTYGFHVLRLEGRTLVPFEEVRAQVMLDLDALHRAQPEPAEPGPPLGLPRSDAEPPSPAPPAAPLRSPSWERPAPEERPRLVEDFRGRYALRSRDPSCHHSSRARIAP